MKIAKKSKAHKINRKDLKQPDQFIDSTNKTVEWLQNYRTPLIAMAFGAVILAFAVFTFQATKENTSKKASDLMDEALTIFEAEIDKEEDKSNASASASTKTYSTAKEKYTAALKRFQNIQKETTPTAPSHFANLYIGHCHYHLKQYDPAIKAYNAFLASITEKDPTYFLGVNALAYAWEAKGKPQKGIAFLEGYLEKGSKETYALVLERLAAHYLANQNKTKAIMYYTKLSKETSPYQETAKKKLALLKP